MTEPTDFPLGRLAEELDDGRPVRPRADFVADLRSRLELELVARLPDRTTEPEESTMAAESAPILPYLTVHDGVAAIAFYVAAFGAVEEFRVPMDDGRVGHAELLVNGAKFMLSDEFVEMGVTAPPTIGGTSVALHVTVDDADAVFAQALAAGATALREPADQPHGARQGTLLDPYGHRWMVSQQIEAFDPATYSERLEGSEYSYEEPASVYTDGIWAAFASVDALALIRFYVEVVGFTERLVVPAEHDPSAVVHSELHWPEGGVLQIGSVEGSSLGPEQLGRGNIYVITDDTEAVYRRCLAAGVEITRDLETPDYDPNGTQFGFVDPEGNAVFVGRYRG